MSKITKEVKPEDYGTYFNVGDLMDYIVENNIPRDAKIFIQRVEDKYFETGGWGVVKKEDWHYRQAVAWNARVDSGELNNKENYPDIDVSNLKKYSKEELESAMSQYYVVFSPVKYNGDDNLYLDAHY